jgi:UDP-N-acetyl-2-amino-2-deoxyglucuronate dehydrogenase
MPDDEPPRGPLGVAIVGAGNIATAHIDAIRSNPDAHLTGISGGRSDGAERLAASHAVRHYPDVAAIAADPEVDLVAICTPSGAHLEPAVTVMRAGKHVIVEKPLEVTSERARALMATAAAAGVTLSVIFNSRFADANAFVQREIAAGTLGRLLQADAYVKWWRSEAYYQSAAWRGTWQLDGGGALMNQAIHHLDLLLWMAGPVGEVFAYADTLAHPGLEVEDTLVAVLRYQSGALGQLSAATSLWPGRAKLLQLHGDQGYAVIEDDVLREWRTRSGDEGARCEALARFGGEATGGAADPLTISFENHRRQYRDVIDAIRRGRKPAIGGEAGLDAVRVIEALYRSLREGRPIRP